jgi:hypothetical protein
MSTTNPCPIVRTAKNKGTTKMPDKKAFDLGDYVEVKDRIKLFYELFGGGRLVTDEVTILTDPSGKQRVMVKALAYRTVDDPHPGTGHSWMELPGTTSYTKGSELENVETSAWGRAIGSLGILIDRSIASAQEVANKQDDRTVDTETGEIHDPDKPYLEVADALVKGVVSFGAPPADGSRRELADGRFIFGFKLAMADGRKLNQVFAEGPLADDIATATSEVSLDGQTVIVHGDIYRVPWKKAGKQMPAFQRLVLTRLVTDAWSIPGEPRVVEADQLEGLVF